jgi:uncharacterized protein with FMN-binding domain
MKRAVIVGGATVVGLVGVLSFHTQPARLTLGAIPVGTASRSSATTTPAGAPPSTTGPPPPSTTTPTTTPAAQGPTTTDPPTTAPATTTPPTTAPATTRSATGPAVNYNFGLISVTVTATGTRITTVSIASLDDGGNPRSQSIDQQSIPILEQQAIQAQSANIQGVSGASYTSSGFQQSLQAALSQLGFT